MTNDLKDIKNPWQMIAFLFLKRQKELLLALVIILVGIMLIMNLGYNENGKLTWRPAAKIEVKKGGGTP